MAGFFNTNYGPVQNGMADGEEEEAEFQRRVSTLFAIEAEESGASVDHSGTDDDDEGEGEGDDLGFGLAPFSNFEDDQSASDSDESHSNDSLAALDALYAENYNDHDGMSDISGATDDSWDEQVEYSVADDSMDIEPGEKTMQVLSCQDRYRAMHRIYTADLGKEGKTLSFPKFGQLPAELRLRIWELHCPAMQRSHRVLQLALAPDGHLSPVPTMHNQTSMVRKFMRISRETRALAEQYLPDTLSIGVSVYDNSILRYNASKDIVHFTIETSFGLNNVSAYLAAGNQANSQHMTTVAAPYPSVRNIAMLDLEIRSRAPGSYFDRINGRSVIELVRREDASHQRPNELRSANYCKALDYLFPNVENIYVLEHGAPRKLDRWIGKQRSYERHHIRTMESEDSRNPLCLEYLYCWHAPPKGFVGRRALPQPEGNSQKEDDDGDFKDECVVNHFAELRQKGVRFSRLLYFDVDSSMDDYYKLRLMTCPDGVWPNGADGQPEQDSLPSIHDGRLAYGMDDDDDLTDDSIVVSDDDEEEGSDSGSGSGSDSDSHGDGHGDEDEDEDEDDLEILGAESVPLEAIFSSPEPEDGDDNRDEDKRASRGKKRRVIRDSDDDKEEEEEAGPSSRSKKRRVAESVGDDDDDEDEDEDDDEKGSSHTEESDKEEPPKKMSLMHILQQNREVNSLSDEEAFGSEEEDDEAEQYAGDYGEGAEDDDDDEDEDDE